MSEPIIVILNPASGSAGDDFRARIEAALGEHGAQHEVRETTPDVSARQLASEAVEAGAHHILACGGDGTIMGVVNGVAGNDPDGRPDVRLSIVPGGTANLLATALSLPMEVPAAVAVAVTGKPRLVDLGRCGDHVFALGVGLGLTERLVSRTSAREKETLGKLAYARAMLRDLGARPQRFMLRMDDGAVRRRFGVGIVIANVGEIGGGLRFAPLARMDDGLLDVCILHRFYFRDLVRLAFNSLLGRLPEDRAVSFYQVRQVEIRSNPPLDLQIDGEEVDTMVPMTAHVIPGALCVTVPAE